MQNKTRLFSRELLWLTISLTMTIFLASVFLGWTFVIGEQELNFHDTYFKVSSWLFLVPWFSFLTFIIYFFKEKKRSFVHTLATCILIIAGLTSIISLTFLIKEFSGITMFTGGWTAYPPLSDIKPQRQLITQNPIAKFIVSLSTIIQAIVLPSVLSVAYRFGTTKSKQHYLPSSS